MLYKINSSSDPHIKFLSRSSSPVKTFPSPVEFPTTPTSYPLAPSAHQKVRHTVTNLQLKAACVLKYVLQFSEYQILRINAIWKTLTTQNFKNSAFDAFWTFSLSVDLYCYILSQQQMKSFTKASFC